MWNVPTIIDEPVSTNVEVYYMDSDQSYRGEFKYLVACNPKGEWSCSCPDWVYRRPTDGCKHIRRLLKWRDEKGITLPVVSVGAAIPIQIARFASLDV